ncbi:MAG: zinc finger protein [Candidatus Poseidonia sp.]|uniref:zinc finger Ran-binding domain-containing protein n=1 Tax=Poseidonia sp. TaxID=2666344 RepID=UPI0030BAC7D3|nr:zinc finger protein [Poseidonia sp.]
MFTGTIESQSHEGGLLVRFEGSSPSLDAILVLAENGTYVGKVDGVLGSTNQPMAHIGHIDRELKLDDLLGSHVTIRAKKPRQDREKFRRDSRDSRDSRDRSGGNDRRNDSHRNHRGDRGDRREQGSSFNDNDWTCPECKNSNFAFRQVCNRCEAPRPGGRGGSRDNGGRSDRRPQRDGGRYEQRGGNNRQEIYNDNDWTCRECNNSNFAFRQVCNRCEAPRPGGGGGRSSGGRDGGRGYGGGNRGGDRGGDRRSSGGDRRDNNRRPQSNDSNYRHAKGKRPGHAHNRGPNALQPRKPDRYDD